MKLLPVTLMLAVSVCSIPADAAEYATARIATPVMNSPDMKAVFGGATGRNLKVDRCGQVRELEFIALPETRFTILKIHSTGRGDVYQVATDEYPVPPATRLYIDGRFLTPGPSDATPRRRTLPLQDEIVATLRSTVGMPYVWGGNVPAGVPELASWFFTGMAAADGGRTLAGLDCSGLLYFATGGWTPRNSSQLISYGRGVAVAGRKSAEISALLQPLDLIVWNGHVIIVLDRQTAIESRLDCGAPGNGGVVLTPLTQRINEITRTRRPADSWPAGNKSREIFVVRRWYAP